MTIILNTLLTLFFLTLAILEASMFSLQPGVVWKVIIVLKVIIFTYIMLHFANKLDNVINKIKD